MTHGFCSSPFNPVTYLAKKPQSSSLRKKKKKKNERHERRVFKTSRFAPLSGVDFGSRGTSRDTKCVLINGAVATAAGLLLCTRALAWPVAEIKEVCLAKRSDLQCHKCRGTAVCLLWPSPPRRYPPSPPAAPAASFSTALRNVSLLLSVFSSPEQPLLRPKASPLWIGLRQPPSSPRAPAAPSPNMALHAGRNVLEVRRHRENCIRFSLFRE